MNARDLTDLTDRFGLPSSAASHLAQLGHRLITDPLAPTTVREPAKVRDDHFADALVALELPVVRQAQEMMDIGAGAGIPGLVLAAALPEARIRLVEGNGRKCAFMRSAATDMGLGNVEIIHARAEELREVGGCDVVTARALAPLDVVAEYAAPLLREGGTLVAWRGKPEPDVEAAGRRAAEVLGLCVQPPVQVHPYLAAEHRYLHLMTKVRATPPQFPRRPGMARKRPLGA